MKKTTILAALVPFLIGAVPKQQEIDNDREMEIRTAPPALQEMQRGVEPVTVEGIFRWHNDVQRASINGTGFILGADEDYDYYLTFNLEPSFLELMASRFLGVELIGGLTISLGGSYNLEHFCEAEPYAVLRTPHREERTALLLGNSDFLQENNKLYIIGYANNISFSLGEMNRGMHQDFPRYLEEGTTFSFVGPIMDGFGGGPLLAEDAENNLYVVGVFAFYDSAENLNAGIRINSVLETLEENGCEVPVNRHDGEVEFQRANY